MILSPRFTLVAVTTYLLTSYCVGGQEANNQVSDGQDGGPRRRLQEQKKKFYSVADLNTVSALVIHLTDFISYHIPSYIGIMNNYFFRDEK